MLWGSVMILLYSNIPVSFRVSSLALGQLRSSASEATLKGMGKLMRLTYLELPK